MLNKSIFFFFSGFIVFIRLKSNETEHNKTFASVQPITMISACLQAVFIFCLQIWFIKNTILLQNLQMV